MSLTRSLTRPLTRKISRADLTQGFGGSFSPFALDPYLLFDARDSMVGTLENPTLDLNPALPETLDVITATRAGIATYTDPDGNIATASADTVRVDYTQGAELTPTKFQNIGYTDFSQGWQTYNNGTSASDGGGYNGNPSKVIEALTAYGSYSYQVPTQDGVTYCLSFYIKRVSGSGDVRLSAYNATGTTTFDITSSITSEFTRVSAVFQGRSGGGDVRVGVQDYGSGDMEVEIAMPQVEEGTTASDFVENTSGNPKFIASATHADRVAMVLIEPSATNLFRNSQDLTASPNNVAKGTLTEESETFKGQPVFRLTDDTSSGEHRLSIPAGSVTASRVIVHFFVKPDTCTKFCITYPTAGDAGAAWNLQSGSALGSTVGSAVAQTIEDAGDGWFKVSMTYDRPSATTTGHNIQTLQDSATSAANRNYQGDGTLSFLMTMPQLEYGEVQTSFIPTSGSTVTRAADDLVITGSDFDFYNQSEGTFYVESVPNENTSGSFLFDLTKISGGSERLLIYNGGSNQKVYISTASTNWVDKIIGTRPAGGVLSRVAISYETNNVQASLDGVNMVPDPSATMSTSIAKMTIGNRYETSRYLNGRIRRLIFWPYSSDRL